PVVLPVGGLSWLLSGLRLYVRLLFGAAHTSHDVGFEVLGGFLAVATDETHGDLLVLNSDDGSEVVPVADLHDVAVDQAGLVWCRRGFRSLGLYWFGTFLLDAAVSCQRLGSLLVHTVSRLLGELGLWIA